MNKRTLLSVAECALEAELWPAPFRWPVFSVTSSVMVLKLKRQGIVPGTVLDVGANVGQFSTACAEMFPGVRIVAFEPLPECFARLSRIAARHPNFSARRMALGDRPQAAASFHRNRHSHSSSMLPLAEAHLRSFPEAAVAEIVQVPCSTLDDEIDLARLVPPALLKIDVQGYEEAVLRGGGRTLAGVSWILLETSFKPLYSGERVFAEIAELLGRHGFVFRRPVATLPDPASGEVLQMDALFVNRTLVQETPGV